MRPFSISTIETPRPEICLRTTGALPSMTCGPATSLRADTHFVDENDLCAGLRILDRQYGTGRLRCKASVLRNPGGRAPVERFTRRERDRYAIHGDQRNRLRDSNGKTVLPPRDQLLNRLGHGAVRGISAKP